MSEKKSPLVELELHVKNRPKGKLRFKDCHSYYTLDYGEYRNWVLELVGKTQELSLSVAGKERSLRKQLRDAEDRLELVAEKEASLFLRNYVILGSCS